MSKPREKLLILSLIALIVVSAAFLAYLIYIGRARANLAPVVLLDSSEIRVSVNATEEELLRGVTAIDPEDGDLSASLVVENISPFIGKNRCTITYAAFDSANKVGTASRTLYYTDYHSPRFELLSDFIYASGEVVKPFDSIRAFDCIDGDITNRISMSWVDEASYTGGGAGQVRFRVINSRGDVSTLVVNVVTDERLSQSTPEIELSNYITYVKTGESVSPLDFVKSVTVLRKEYTRIGYGAEKFYFDDRAFDKTKPGVYRIPIYCENGDQLGRTVLTVVVEE